MAEEGKEIVKREEHPVLITVSNALFKSGLFPNVKNAFGAYAIVQYGSELGIGPMTALQTMAIVSGKVCMGAQMMLSLALKSGNNAATSGAFVPFFTLGIPPNVIMALLFGALIIHGIRPGPLLLQDHPDIFWGVVCSMYIGNVMLLILNLPLIPIWVQVL